MKRPFELVNALHLLLNQRILYLQDITFKLEMNHLTSTNQFTYLGIPFNESLNLEPSITKINS